MLSLRLGAVPYHTAINVLAEVGSAEAEAELKKLACKRRKRSRCDDDCSAASILPALASDALITLYKRQGRVLDGVAAQRAEELAKLAALQDTLLNAGEKEDRCQAAYELFRLGSTAAIPALRAAFRSDATHTVREAAAYALASLGDAGLIDTLIRLLGDREDQDETAKMAAYALGHLGDVRGLPALLAAYRAGWKPGVLSDALRGYGVLAVESVVSLIDQDPGLAKRQALQNVARQAAPGYLAEFFIRRLDAQAKQPGFVSRAGAYLKLVGDQELACRHAIAEHVLALVEGEDKEAKALKRAAKRVLATNKKSA
jgi:hypothetical protein